MYSVHFKFVITYLAWFEGTIRIRIRNELENNIQVQTKTFRTHNTFYLRTAYTDIKGNQIILIYKEIQSGAVAKTYWEGLPNIRGNAQIFHHI